MPSAFVQNAKSPPIAAKCQSPKGLAYFAIGLLTCPGWQIVQNVKALRALSFAQNLRNLCKMPKPFGLCPFAQFACALAGPVIVQNAKGLCPLGICPNARQMLQNAILAFLAFGLLPCRAGTFLEPWPAIGFVQNAKLLRNLTFSQNYNAQMPGLVMLQNVNCKQFTSCRKSR